MINWHALKAGDAVIVVVDDGQSNVFRDAASVGSVAKGYIRVGGRRFSRRTGTALGLVSGGGSVQMWLEPVPT